MTIAIRGGSCASITSTTFAKSNSDHLPPSYFSAPRTRRGGRTRHGNRKPQPRKHYYYDDDMYLDDDRHDDDYYYSPKSRKGKKGGKGKGSYSAGKDFWTSAKDNAFLDDAFFDDHFFEDDDCELVTFNETFAMGGPTLFLAPDTTPTNAGDPTLPGTVFIFERVNILELDGVTPINGTVVSGTCTRTTVGTDGGGVCHLVFVDEDGFSINVNGDLQSPLGGPLAITGGTGGMVGVVGEVDLFPIFETDTQFGDIFLDPIRFEVLLDLGLIVCP